MRATLRDGGIDGEASTFETRQNLVVYPGREDGALLPRPGAARVSHRR
jgi:hypothetical protein